MCYIYGTTPLKQPVMHKSLTSVGGALTKYSDELLSGYFVMNAMCLMPQTLRDRLGAILQRHRLWGGGGGGGGGVYKIIGSGECTVFLY